MINQCEKKVCLIGDRLYNLTGDRTSLEVVVDALSGHMLDARDNSLGHSFDHLVLVLEQL